MSRIQKCKQMFHGALVPIMYISIYLQCFKADLGTCIEVILFLHAGPFPILKEKTKAKTRSFFIFVFVFIYIFKIGTYQTILNSWIAYITQQKCLSALKYVKNTDFRFLQPTLFSVHVSKDAISLSAMLRRFNYLLFPLHISNPHFIVQAIKWKFGIHLKMKMDLFD